MLQGKLSLYEVEDVESLCARVIQHSGLELSFHDHELLLAFLVETAWEISLTYQPSTPPRFAIYLQGILRRRVVDWQRNRNGRTRWQFADRTYERPRPQFCSLDDRLDEAEPGVSVDDEVHSRADLSRILGTGSSSTARTNDTLGTAAPRKAA